MRGNRPSSLPLAQFCPLAPKLGARHGAIREAIPGTYMHAVGAGQTKEADRLHALMTPAECGKVARWKLPDTFEALGCVFAYQDAKKEFRVTLTEGAQPAPVDNGDDCMTAGTVDFHWAPRRFDGGWLLVVGDLKSTEWGTPDGPYSLQIAAYAFGLAAFYGQLDQRPTHIVRCLWDLSAARWNFAEPLEMESPEAAQLWMRVKAAALNTEGQGVTGSHCQDCYDRTRCPEYMIDIEAADKQLTALGLLDKSQWDAPTVLRILRLLERVGDSVEWFQKEARAWAREHGGIPDEDGERVWAPGQVKGKPKLDREALEAAHPGTLALLEEFTHQGPGYLAFRWRKQR